MIRHLRLVMRNIIRNKRRTILTLLSIAAPLCVLGMMMARYRGFFLCEPPRASGAPPNCPQQGIARQSAATLTSS